MIAATASRDRRWSKAGLAVSLLICAHSVRAEEPVRARVTDQDYEPVWRSIEAELRNSQSIAPGQPGAQTGTTPIVESTGFEEEDGWVPGWICGPDFEVVCVDDPDGAGDPEQTCGVDNPNPQTGWWLHNGARSCSEPHIATANPLEGKQHLRLALDPLLSDPSGGPLECPPPLGECTVSAFSPLTGPHLIGQTTVSMEIATSNNFGSHLRIMPQSASEGSITALVDFDYYGFLYVYDGGLNEYVYVDSGWPPNSVYRNLTIDIDPCEPALRYFYGGELIWTDTSGVVPFAQTVENVALLAYDFLETQDIDNFSIVRGEPCPHECGNDAIEVNEDCEPTDDSACPGRCIPPGEEGECTCIRPGPTCEEAQELPLGTVPARAHGGWFTFTAEAPTTAVETCGSNGFDADFTVWTGDCDDLLLTTSTSQCQSGHSIGPRSDPLASCYGDSIVREACRCFPTEIGRRYWVEVPRAVIAGAVTKIARSNRIMCDAIWENGACCDRVTGECVDDVSEIACAGPDQDWFAQHVCEAVFCRTTAIPTVSDWGLVILTLLGLTIGSVVFRGKQSGSTSADAAGAP